MDDKSRLKISQQYDDLVKKYGDSIKALHIENARYNKEHQNIKFRFVSNQLNKKNSLLDVGCGLGNLAEYCTERGWEGQYTGIDISQKMVNIVKKKLRTDNVHQIDILEDNYNIKHDVVVSISTLQEKPPYENSFFYLENMIEKMFDLSTECVIFDVFSKISVDYMDPKNLYVDPLRLMKILYKLTNRLIIYNNYNPYQLMIVLFKKKYKSWG